MQRIAPAVVYLGPTLPREVVAGFEPTEVAAPPDRAAVPGTGGIKGKRPSKKDKLRAQAASDASGGDGDSGPGSGR